MRLGRPCLLFTCILILACVAFMAGRTSVTPRFHVVNMGKVGNQRYYTFKYLIVDQHTGEIVQITESRGRRIGKVIRSLEGRWFPEPTTLETKAD